MNGQVRNGTSELILHILAFSTSQNGQYILFTIILLAYLIIFIGNTLILTIVCLEKQLHTSMYFFLCNLSVLDIFYVSTTLPKLLYICVTGDHAVSYSACIVQLYLYMFCAENESFLLVTMAIDRYVAICFPLHYTLIISKRVRVLLVLPPWFLAAINALILTSFVNGLTFSGFNKVNNFFCDLKALLIVSSSDTRLLKNVIVIDGMFIGAVPALLILTSYTCIISTILKIKSSAERKKTFSSCASHITIVAVYYGSAFCLYMQYSQERDTLLSVMFVILVPMLNPVVYSLRNKDIIRALRRINGSVQIFNNE